MRYVSEDHFRSMKNGVLRNGDVLIVKDGATTGKIGFFAHDIPAAVNEHVFILRAKDFVEPQYLYRCVRADVFQGKLRPFIKGIIGGISLEFADITIPLPPLDVQKEIVAEIEGYQKVIDGARAVIDNYRPHIPIQPEWPMVLFDELCVDFQNGANFTKEQMGRGTCFVNIKDLFSSGYIDCENLGRVELSAIEIERKMLKPDDLLFVRSSVKEEGVGFPSLMSASNEPVVFCGFIIKCTPNMELVLPGYLLHLLRTPEYRGKVVSLSNRANITNISQDSLKSLPIPLPSLETQRAIVAEIEAEQALVNANRELIERMVQKIQACLARVWGEEINNG